MKLVVFKLILCSGLQLEAFSYTSIGLESLGTKRLLLSYSIPLCLSFNLACVQCYNMGTLSSCLADVCLGRYKIIHWSILIMWIASVLVVASSVLSQFVTSYYYITYATAVLFIIICIAFGELTNFRMLEITSFISWYMCTWFSSMAINYFIDVYLSERYSRLLEKFAICICLTLMVTLAIAFDRVFLKEPITQNPFQLIYKIIKYAIKTKHPRCQSAFTYCEDELPSHINFGKRKYGGPFTTEEVENVKTF